MKLTLFSRLMIGYAIIFVLMMAMSIYAILKLHQFNAGNSYILNIDKSILNYKKKLTDTLVAQQRFESEYVLSRDIVFYQRFLAVKEEFNEYLAEVRSIADTPQKKESLKRVKEDSERYQSLVQEEGKLIGENQKVNKKWYEQEKEKASAAALRELEMLEVYSWQDISDRMKMLGEAGTSARNVAIVMALGSIFLVTISSFFITRSVTRPLNLLMDKTREIPQGVFKGDLSIPSPPEISELTQAFNLMVGKLKAVDKMKSDFLSIMSHELRTPLTSIKEGTNLLLEGVGGIITEKQKRLLTIIAEESDRLIRLVNSLLDLSKMEAGMMIFTREPASLGPLIEQAITEISPLVEAKKIIFETEIREELPLIKMDSEKILQVLRNLIGNAVKFTPDGGRVRASARPVNGGVEFSVADTGPGIPSEKLAMVFDKFQQVPTPGSRGTRGTGLGLAIVQHIIKSHGGKVWVESQLGQGSTFIFVLPV
jgi:two-component system sensor histidine kinase GlrK